MYTVDLHLKNETVEDAKYNLKQTISLAKKTKEKIVCLIVGYGSTGGTHKIKTNVLVCLEELKEKHQIRDFIVGSDISIFNSKYQNLKGRELLPQDAMFHSNQGQIFVIL